MSVLAESALRDSLDALATPQEAAAMLERELLARIEQLGRAPE